MRKWIKVYIILISLVVLLLICCFGLLEYMDYKKDKPHFSGEVVSIDSDTLLVEATDGTIYTVVWVPGSFLHYCHLEQDLYLGDVQVGDKVYGWYKPFEKKKCSAESVVVIYPDCED